MQEEYVPMQSGDLSFFRELFEWVESGILAVVCVVLVFTFVGRMVGVVGESMLPTLENNDRLVSTRLYDRVQPGDIVVVTKPNEHNEPLIKRVIAVGGQTIDIDGGTGFVYVDGELIQERYIKEPIAAGFPFQLEFPQVVPIGYVFIMGDNRNNSWDSRMAAVGMVDERYILGKVIFRVWPYERFGQL